MKIHPTMLAAKVAAYNRLHAEANRLSAVRIEYLRQFIGKKIILATDRIAAKVADGLPPVSEIATNADGFRIWHDSSDYTLRFGLSCSEHLEHGCVSIDCYLSLGRLEDGILTAVSERDNFRTDYTVDEVRRLQKALTDAKAAASNAESALRPFGEFDR